MYSEGAFACTDVQCIHVHTLYEVFLCFRLFSIIILNTILLYYFLVGNDFHPVVEVTSLGDLSLSIGFPGIILEVFTLHIR